MKSVRANRLVRGNWSRALGVGLLYFLSAALTIRFTRFEGGAAFLWIATAVLLAELSLTPTRRWGPIIIVATMTGICATSFFGIGALGAPFLAPFTIGEPVAAALLIHRLRGQAGIDLGSLKGVALFTAIAGIVAPFGSAAGAAAVIAVTTGTPYGSNFEHWLIGHALGTITFTPLMLLVLSGKLRGKFASLGGVRRLEALGLTVAMVAISFAVLRQDALPLLFLPQLPLLIASFRFGRAGGAVGIAILTAIGVILTIQGHGPVHLMTAPLATQATFLEFYLAVSALMNLPIAAELQQRAILFLALQESEARYRLIAERSSDVILNVGRDGRISYVSPSITILGGYDPDSLVGTIAGTLVLEGDRRTVAAAHARAMADPSATHIVEYRGLARDGSLVWCESHTRGIADARGKVIGAVSAIRDISHRKAIESELAHAAATDPLTELGNRRAFDRELRRRILQVRAGQGIGACAILDLDHFKQINDSFGHEAGDRVLRLFAAVASKALREGDMIARLGGEEFGLILWGSSPTEAHRICERLRSDVEDLLIPARGGRSIALTFSGGVASIDPEKSLTAILREADDAMYEAKAAGRNRLALAA